MWFLILEWEAGASWCTLIAVFPWRSVRGCAFFVARFRARIRSWIANPGFGMVNVVASSVRLLPTSGGPAMRAIAEVLLAGAI